MSDDKTVMQSIQDLMSQVRKDNAYLIVISGKAVGKMFKLSGPELTIGRGADVEILLEDDGISRKHAKIIRLPDGTVRVMDLGSTNGTYFNGQRIDLQTLKDGDKIQIGSATILKFSYQDNLEEQFQKQLYESATKDGLTRVYNKKFFLDRLRHEFAYCLRHKVILSLCMFDIDWFKKVNDTYGHQAGDAVLVRLANIVSEQVRTEDIFCRYGGEEFSVILREIDEEKAFIFAERVRRAVEKAPFALRDNSGQDHTIQVTISMGMATLRDASYPTPEELIVAADKYLYRAKQGGRNRVVSKSLG
jgi:diguanylate cyclase (GGDEF)-like protein